MKRGRDDFWIEHAAQKIHKELPWLLGEVVFEQAECLIEGLLVCFPQEQKGDSAWPPGHLWHAGQVVDYLAGVAVVNVAGSSWILLVF